MTEKQNKHHKSDIAHSYILSKVGDLSRGGPEGSLFNSYHTEV